MSNDSRKERMMQRLLQAFRDFGYSQVTMSGLASACDMSPRALYNHFKGKEDAFREVFRWNHAREIRQGWEAGKWSLADGGGAVDVVVAILDARFGKSHRHLELSPHTSELNVEAFRRCRDIMEEFAIVFQAGFAVVLKDLEQRNLLRLRPTQTAYDSAQLLTDGAHGVNQPMPKSPANTLPTRYRRMCEALMFGFAEMPARTGRPVLPPSGGSDNEGMSGRKTRSRGDVGLRAQADVKPLPLG